MPIILRKQIFRIGVVCALCPAAWRVRAGCILSTPRLHRLIQIRLFRGIVVAKVEIYTNRGCPSCVSAKQLLDSKGVKCSEKKLGRSKSVDIEFQIRTNGAKSVPQIFIGGELIGGFDDLIRFESANELNWRLGLEPRPKISIGQRIIRFMKGHRYR